MRKQLCGIYAIKCIVDNKIKRIYVGQSSNLLNRKYTHFTKLKRNEHSNSLMQRHYNKYGLSSFSFEIIEHCIPSQLTQREQYWFDYYKSQYEVFNQGEFTDSPTRGVKASEERKQKISKSGKGRPNPHSDEHKKKLSEAAKRRTDQQSHSDKTIKKISESLRSFSKEEVREIRRLRKMGKTMVELRELYGCGQKLMHRIIHHISPYDFK